MSRRLVLFLASVYLGGAVAAAAMLSLGPPPRQLDALLFVALIYVSDALSVSLPRGGAVGVAFAGSSAAMMVFGPGVPTLAAMLSALNPDDIRSGKEARWRLFNAAQLSLSTAAMYLVYRACGGLPLLSPSGESAIRFLDAAGIMAGSAAFFVVNTGLTAASFALSEGAGVFRVWLDTFRWLVVNYLALALVGMLTAATYLAAGVPGLLLLVVPLAVARQTFAVYMRRRAAYLETVHALVAAIEAKDPHTRGHSERVADYAERTAEAMGLNTDDAETLRFAALLHDLGKIGIERKILNKPAELTREEFDVVKKHPDIAAHILDRIGFLEPALPAISGHHERIDGGGYCKGAAGDGIPISARILAVADCFDAMTSSRPYRPALSTRDAVGELIRHSGTQFDPAVVGAFLKVMHLERLVPEGEGESRGQLSLGGLGS